VLGLGKHLAEQGHAAGRELGVLAVAGDTAAIAVAPLAVLGVGFAYGTAPFSLEITLADTGVDDIPREGLVDGLLTEFTFEVDFGFVDGLAPGIEVEVIIPTVKNCSEIVGSFDGPPELPASTRKQRLEGRFLRVRPVQTDPLDSPETILEIPDPPLLLLGGDKGLPLKRSPRLG